MKNFLSIAILSFAAFVCLTGNSRAESKLVPDAGEEFGFSSENRLGDNELSGMRGGLRIGALNFDFAITSRTIVDGVLQHTATITSTIIANNQATAIITYLKEKDGAATNNNNANNPIPNIPIPDIDDVVDDANSDNTIANTNVANNDVTNNDVANNGVDDVDNSVISNDVINNNNTPDASIPIPSGVGVIVNTETLTTTIQNSNDNAVIQQLNQLDITVSNLSELQKLNVAHQFDFQAVQSLK